MTYKVTLNFAGFVGCDNEYIVDAKTEEEAIDLAKEEAVDDLSLVNIEIEEED